MKNLFAPVSELVTAKAAKVAASVWMSAQRRKPVKINQKAYVITLAMLTIGSAAHAQGRVGQGVSALATTMITVVNYLLPALVIVGVCICVWRAIRDQDFGSYAMGVIAALIVWGGLNAFKDDIFGMFGGSTNLQIE
jgi:hypothetical protein